MGSVCDPNGIKEDLKDFVGSSTTDTLATSCKCLENQFGPFCDSIPQEKDLGLCGKGRYNKKNYLTGCECRDEDDYVVPYHGWYCEFHNKLLCKDKNPFYDAYAMGDTVGEKTPQLICKTCTKFFPNCEECLQDETTSCKFQKGYLNQNPKIGVFERSVSQNEAYEERNHVI